MAVTEGGALRLGARPLAGRMGAVVSGIDLRTPLAGSTVEELHLLLAEKGVVIFTDQDIEPAGHLALARSLGEIRRPPEHFVTLGEQGYPEIGVLASKPGGLGTDVWHADVTWDARPPRYSVLVARELPEAGGDTMWASLIEGYERLSSPMRQFLVGLSAEHVHPVGHQSAVHPVVHRHPVTGRLALSVSPFWTRRIVELDEAESKPILGVLFDKIIQPESTCRWQWNRGDVAIWDNHFVLHYAIHDYGDARRVIHRVEVEGEPLVPA